MQKQDGQPAVVNAPDEQAGLPTVIEETKRLSLICFSGEFDKIVATLTLATGASAVGYDVKVFFTFWGLNLVKQRRGHRPIGKGFLGRFFNLLQGGRNNLPLSRLNFGGLSPRLMTYMMKRRSVATLDELLTAAKELKIGLYACEMSMHIMGTAREDLIPEVKEVIGVAKFLEYSSGGERLFI